MMYFQELERYIRQQAVAYRAADEEWQYDSIDLDTFREILRFAISEGFQADAKVIDRVLNGEDETADYEEEDSYTDWHYMGILSDLMNEQITKRALPEETTLLYKTWLFESRDLDPKFWDSE